MPLLRSRRREEEAENPFWITYSDLLSSLVMVFLILVMAFQAISTLQARDLEEKQKLLELQKKELEKRLKQTEKLSDEVKKLNIQEQAKQLEKLTQRLNELRKKFPDVEVDQESGEVRIKEKILFQTGDTRLQSTGRSFLKSFMPKWTAIVTDPEYDEIIKQVVFEGHADPVGSPDWNRNYLENLNLTLARSESVTQFVFSGECPLDAGDKERLRALVATSGRSNIEAYLATKDKHPDWGPEKILRTPVGASRSVSLKLTFNNPLLKWSYGRETR